MDFYTLDNQLRRIAIFDQYESLIWTERYAAGGDFQMEILSERNTREAMTVGTFCTVSDTKRVCVIETVEDVVSSGGKRTLRLSGRGLESVFFSDRAATVNKGLSDGLTWDRTATPAGIARALFNDFVVDTSLPDKLPFYTPGNLFTPGSIPEPPEVITMSLENDSLYASLVKICEMYNLGFRLARNDDASQLYFDVYTGDDRTTLQKINTAVVFSPELDNLSGTSEVVSNASQKNVAYVATKFAFGTVYADGWDVSSAVGFARRVLYVKAEDIELETGPELSAAIRQRGLEELSKNRTIIAFDGEIPQHDTYEYGPGKNYDLGDLIEVRNADGLATSMRVVEHIRVSDSSGIKAYPTLVSELLVTQGSWLSFAANGYWDFAIGEWVDA